jgi:hypothetical protein
MSRPGKHKFVLGVLTGLVIAVLLRSTRSGEKWNRP